MKRIVMAPAMASWLLIGLGADALAQSTGTNATIQSRSFGCQTEQAAKSEMGLVDLAARLRDDQLSVGCTVLKAGDGLRIIEYMASSEMYKVEVDGTTSYTPRSEVNIW